MLNLIFACFLVTTTVILPQQFELPESFNNLTFEQKQLASIYMQQNNSVPLDSDPLEKPVSSLKTSSSNITLEQSKLESEYNFVDLENELNIFYGTHDSDQVPKKINQFGYNLFHINSNNLNSNVGHPPINYKLQANDVVTVFMYGKKEQVNQFSIDENGVIFYPGVGPIIIGGLNMKLAKKVLLKKLNKKFVNIEIELKLNTQKPVSVMIAGDIGLPGTYSVNKFASIFTLLAKANGINKTGSLRKLVLMKSNGDRINIDLYDYLLKKTAIDPLFFSNGDILFVPKIGETVAIKGEIKQPAIYEVLPGETVADIIKYSSGFSLNAYKNALSISRLNNRFKRSVFEIQSKDNSAFLKKLSATEVNNGDIIYVVKRSNIIEGFVRVLGNVNVPSNLAFYSNMTIKDAFRKVEGTKNDSYEYIHIYRYKSPTQKQIIRKKLSDISFKLKSQDTIVVYNSNEIVEPKLITVSGEIMDEGKILFFENMTLFDALILVKPKDFASLNKIEIIRFDGDTSKVFYVSGQDAKSTFLAPGDKINIKYDNLKDQTVEIELIGEFVFPGKYKVNKGTRLSEVIQKAGGYTNSAYLKAAIFSRKSVKEYDQLGQDKVIEDEKRRLIYDQSHLGSLSTDSQMSFGVMMAARQEALKFLEKKSGAIEGRVVIDLYKDEFITSNDNFMVQEGDVLEIPTQPESVHLIGGVQQGISIAYNPSFKTNDYILNVGGFTKYADKSNIYVFKTSGRVFQNYSNIEPGDIIYVPEKVHISFNWLQFLTNITSIISNAVTSIALVRSIQ